MKLSQFNFKLPAAQVALYPHKTKRVVKTASGVNVHSRLPVVTSLD